MPHLNDATADALAAWRDAERRLAGHVPSSPAWDAAAEQRDQAKARYEQAVADAEAEHPPVEGLAEAQREGVPGTPPGGRDSPHHPPGMGYKMLVNRA